MKEFILSDLLELLAIPTHSGQTDTMYNYLLDLGWGQGWDMFSDKTGNLYAIKGQSETYPCAVAHTDTVHHIENGGIHPVVINGKVTGINPLDMSQTGIGGDDKCGIWAALRCLHVLPACKAVFFVDEERGCRGSNNCDMTFFKDCRFILQADRRGNSDFVNEISGFPLYSPEFKEAVAPIVTRCLYKEHEGMTTDVGALCENKVGISVANMSAGYYAPHSSREYINLQDLGHACLLMETIFREVTEIYPFVSERKVWSSSATIVHHGGSNFNTGGMGSRGIGSHGDFASGSSPAGYSNIGGEIRRCCYCGEVTIEMDLFEKDPPVCLDCEIFKEGHGFYPVSGTSSIWEKLSGNRFMGKRKKKKKKGNIIYVSKEVGEKKLPF